MASTAYDSGRTSEIGWSTDGSWSRTTSRPHSRNCGSTKAGMNCTAWNSVRANPLASRPSAVPSTASATATITSTHAGPARSRSQT